ncbi:hypothetical protein CONPUDRAFT_169155 [Coniophora puteana RWD-64-598 SS2]|uniref:Uncharacterized protein n=1 Tax=Coniophora puteana (strain RWD-64-598) TaxID=741705 RepID=A0A5M3MBB0_CONPW|nr:uncharacterized protein CONPUDRAFT_169155 [Coniophora puteana RWD-64-598 SS2]EIW75915.1 hypothetical protein CONPUDRAFT_169155 [Coniophora puteana RWD-64-598 SS2]
MSFTTFFEDIFGSVLVEDEFVEQSKRCPKDCEHCSHTILMQELEILALHTQASQSKIAEERDALLVRVAELEAIVEKSEQEQVQVQVQCTQSTYFGSQLETIIEETSAELEADAEGNITVLALQTCNLRELELVPNAPPSDVSVTSDEDTSGVMADLSSLHPYSEPFTLDGAEAAALFASFANYDPVLAHEPSIRPPPNGTTVAIGSPPMKSVDFWNERVSEERHEFADTVLQKVWKKPLEPQSHDFSLERGRKVMVFDESAPENAQAGKGKSRGGDAGAHAYEVMAVPGRPHTIHGDWDAPDFSSDEDDHGRFDDAFVWMQPVDEAAIGPLGPSTLANILQGNAARRVVATREEEPARMSLPSTPLNVVAQASTSRGQRRDADVGSAINPKTPARQPLGEPKTPARQRVRERDDAQPFSPLARLPQEPGAFVPSPEPLDMFESVIQIGHREWKNDHLEPTVEFLISNSEAATSTPRETLGGAALPTPFNLEGVHDMGIPGLTFNNEADLQDVSDGSSPATLAEVSGDAAFESFISNGTQDMDMASIVHENLADGDAFVIQSEEVNECSNEGFSDDSFHSTLESLSHMSFNSYKNESLDASADSDDDEGSDASFDSNRDEWSDDSFSSSSGDERYDSFDSARDEGVSVYHSFTLDSPDFSNINSIDDPLAAPLDPRDLELELNLSPSPPPAPFPSSSSDEGQARSLNTVDWLIASLRTFTPAELASFSQRIVQPPRPWWPHYDLIIGYQGMSPEEFGEVAQRLLTEPQVSEKPMTTIRFYAPAQI